MSVVSPPSPGVVGIHATGSAGSTEAPEIGDNEVKTLELLGKGNFGQVFKGMCRGKIVAVKRLFQKELESKVLEEFRKEVAVLTHLRHPNIILFMGACTEPGKLAMVTEFMPSGDIAKIVHSPGSNLSLITKLRMGRDIAQGMNWLHCSKPPIIHRDLKPGNLLVDENMNVKICDFGLSNFQRTKTFKDEGFAAGTPLWMAPEVLLGKNLTEKVDVYSFAIVFWEMITGKEPFTEFSSFNTFVDAVVDNNVRPAIPTDLHPSVTKLIRDCWEAEYYMRPSFKDIITRIESIMVDATLSDKTAAAMWKNYFAGQTHVPWPKFVTAFYKELKETIDVKKVDYRCLRKILTSDSEVDDKLVVQLEQFGFLFKWFGPMLTPTWNILQRLTGAMKNDWFHGDMERQNCETMLAGFTHAPGTFLVRLSTTEPIEKTPFSISKVTRDGTVSHQRVNVKDSGSSYYVSLKRKDGSLKDIIVAGGVENLVNENKSMLGLENACPGSAYSALFKDATPKGGYSYDMDVEDDTDINASFH
jgi:serine/threonine protein kinase